MSMRSVLRRASQALACATALGSGAALAHLTHAEAQSEAPEWSASRSRRAATPSLVAAGSEPATAAPAETRETTVEDEVDLPLGVAPPVHDPFGEHLRDGMVMTGVTRHRMLLFTFDDGPELRTTPTLLESLDELGVKAVFFVNATRFDSDSPRERAQADLLKEILRRGHFIGNHTYHHLALTDLDNDQIRVELRKNEDFIFRVTGGRPVLVRPPYGAFSPRVARTLNELGYTPMLWNLASGDTMVRSADEVVTTFHRVLRRRERENGDYGGIVLMHDTHGWSVDAFPRIVASLRQKNCELLGTGEELYDFVDDPGVFFRFRGDARPETEAPPAEPDGAWLESRQAALRVETERRCGLVATRE